MPKPKPGKTPNETADQIHLRIIKTFEDYMRDQYEKFSLTDDRRNNFCGCGTGGSDCGTVEVVVGGD